MPAGTLSTSMPETTLLPALVVDPVDYLLVDIATGRYLPGCAVHARQLAHEHGLDDDAARDALEVAWQLGFVTRECSGASGIEVWSPDVSQMQLHRLARAMVAAVTSGTRHGGPRPALIDGERDRTGIVELFGLDVPADVDLFLELSRALLGGLAPSLVDDLVVPVAVFFSQAAQRVHRLDLAAGAETRQEIACAMVRALIDGRDQDFADRVADYVVAVSFD